MPRLKRIKIGAINIKMHPHSPDTYISLLEYIKIHNNKLVGKIRGNDFGIMGWIRNGNDQKTLDGQYGEIYKFISFDPMQPWLDISDASTIEIEPGTPPPIPNNLKPNLKKSCFVFIPKNHRLFFDASVITPGSAKRLFDSIFSHQEIKEKFGIIDVEVEQSKEGLEKLLKTHRITKACVKITIPNPDDLSGLDEEVLERLLGSNIRRQTLEQTSDHQDGLIPDDLTRALMRISLSNGKTEITGYNQDGSKVEESTDFHPYFTSVEYDPSMQDTREAFFSEKDRLLKELLENV